MHGILIGEKTWRKIIKKKSSSKFMETAKLWFAKSVLKSCFLLLISFFKNGSLKLDKLSYHRRIWSSSIVTWSPEKFVANILPSSLFVGWVPFQVPIFEVLKICYQNTVTSNLFVVGVPEKKEIIVKFEKILRHYLNEIHFSMECFLRMPKSKFFT